MSIGKVIAASAATVAITFLAMVFTKLEVFSCRRSGNLGRDPGVVAVRGDRAARHPRPHRTTRLDQAAQRPDHRMWRNLAYASCAGPRSIWSAA